MYSPSCFLARLAFPTCHRQAYTLSSPNIHVVPTAPFACSQRPSAASVREALAAGSPSIIAGGAGEAMVLDPHTLEPGEEETVAARVREILLG